MSKEKDIERLRIHLCDSCINEIPGCLDDIDIDTIEYGEANGLDNIIKCPKHEEQL